MLLFPLLVFLDPNLVGEDKIHGDIPRISFLLRIESQLKEALLSYNSDGMAIAFLFVADDAETTDHRQHIDYVPELRIPRDQKLGVAEH